MRFAWHKLFVALALAWVFAPVQVSAQISEMEAGVDARAGLVFVASGVELRVETPGSAAATAATGSVHRHDNATAACCDILMPDSCAISGLAHCAAGASALSHAGQLLTAPSAVGLSLPGQEAPLAARAFSFDPPPPRI